MDDLEVGMKITVHTGPIFLMQCGSEFGDVSVIEREDTSGKGDVLEVKAILLPYIVVVKINSSKYDKDPYKIDTRERKFMKVSEEYEKALLPQDESE